MKNLYNNLTGGSEFSRTLVEEKLPKHFYPSCGAHHRVRTGVYGHIFRTFDPVWGIYKNDTVVRELQDA